MNYLKQEIPFLTFLAIILVAPTLVRNCSSSEANRTEMREAVSGRAHITQAKAEATARRTAPQYSLMGSQFENEEGHLVFEVTLARGPERRYIHVDAASGKILRRDPKQDI